MEGVLLDFNRFWAYPEAVFGGGFIIQNLTPFLSGHRLFQTKTMFYFLYRFSTQVETPIPQVCVLIS